jgi:hypothetical protein
MHLLRSLILKPVLAVCLLAPFVPTPTLGQVPAVEEDLLSQTGDFPEVDADGQGGFVSVWAEILDPTDPGQEIFASLVPPGGSSPGTPFQVNTRVAGPQVSPSVAAGPQGDFMVVWQGGTSEDPTGGDGDREGVFGQLFSPTGARLGPQRRLSEGTAAPQVSPRVAALENGSFAAVWQDQSTARFEIVTRLFSATGAPLGPEQRLSVAGPRNIIPQVASYRNGFAVSWTEELVCPDLFRPARRAVIARFDPSGRRTGKLIRIGRLTCGESTTIVALAGSRAGAVAVLRTNSRTNSGHSVQRLGPTGEILGKPVEISRRLCQGIGEGFFCRYVKDVAMNDQGRFAVVWDISGGFSVFYAQAYSPNVIAGANSVELGFRGSGSDPAIALANNGTVAAALWQDSRGAREETGLFLQRFRAP